MKIVKLDRRHRLFHKGMKYAFKFEMFENEWEKRNRVETILRGMYGWEWEYGNDDWNICRGKVSVFKSAHGKSCTCPYWVGVKNEADITAIMLTI